MKRHTELWCLVAENIGHLSNVDTTRDQVTVTRRAETEGFAFLCIALADFCSDFETALSEGRLLPDHFSGFKRGSDGFPRFLSGLLELVFDRNTMDLLSEPSPDAVWGIRQLTRLFSKMEHELEPAKIEKSMRQFVETDASVEAWSVLWLNSLYRGPIPLDQVPDRAELRESARLFRKWSAILFGDVFDSVNREIDEFKILPKHGPGATADRLVGNYKFGLDEWHERLDKVFPVSEYLIPNHRYTEYLDHVTLHAPEHESPSTVTDVPKTLKGPRLIAMEPTCMQFMQQGVLLALRRSLSRADDLSAPGKRFMSLDDQEPNRQMAKIGSITGGLATLDLSEASDRVPNVLVEFMLAPWPSLAEAYDATRTMTADVRGEIIQLSKFASMGSALCFPTQMFVFATIICVAAEKSGLIDPARSPVKEAHRLSESVQVFGDDIIVPTTLVESVMYELEQIYPFKINHSKSFWEGNFRESCGEEYFMGHDVSIVKVRKRLPTSRSDAEWVESLVSFRNQAYKLGLWRVCQQIDHDLENILGQGRYPVIHENSPAIGRHSFLDYQVDRVSTELHRPEVRAWVMATEPRPCEIEDVPALMKCLASDEIFINPEHLLFSGRPVGVSLKRRWVTPF